VIGVLLGSPSIWSDMNALMNARSTASADAPSPLAPSMFPTATFAIFFLIVLPLSWLAMPKVHRWRPFIIVASYVFYSWWDWRFIFLLAGCTLWNQLLAVSHPPRLDAGAAQGAC
jgi:hypothetical protein